MQLKMAYFIQFTTRTTNEAIEQWWKGKKKGQKKEEKAGKQVSTVVIVRTHRESPSTGATCTLSSFSAFSIARFDELWPKIVYLQWKQSAVQMQLKDILPLCAAVVHTRGHTGTDI